MSFTESQKSQFLAALQARGWQRRNDGIVSPSEKIVFTEPYFENWDLEKMRDTFIRRAGIIEGAAGADWQRTANECRDASSAAQEVLSRGK
jgi:hypothetical protein